jgi:enoyl-CoA hydratase/carnithine racemase
MGEEGQLVTVARHASGVAEVLLDRPQAMNAISTELAARLRDVLRDLAEDGALRAVVLGSTQARAFCVGADLKQRNGYSDAQLRAQRVVYRAMAQALYAVPVPVVAAMAGYALGGGLELGLLSDLIVVDPASVLALPEVSVGVVPGLGGTQLLPRRVGLARAGDLVFTARRVGGEEAVALGVADRLAAAGAVLQEAMSLAVTIAGHSPVGVRSAKQALRLGHDVTVAAGLEIEDAAWRATAFSADRAEGVRAFVEKRPPRWPGTP